MEKVQGATESDVAQSIYLTALCFESEDKWELAKGKYDFVQVSYPGTEQSFEAALHIPNYFRNKGQTELARRAYESTIAYITKLAEQNRGDETESAKALGYLVRAYLDNNDNALAAELLEKLHSQYPKLPEGKLAPLRLADIYENAMRDTAKTIEWLQTFLTENPGATDTQKIRDHLELLKTKSGNRQ
jgi:tetratricopeptide (TPR) repeat protein